MRKYRSVFISDVHLGHRGCQSYQLLNFLEHIKCDNLYLIGDIIDVWAMKRKLYWPQSHNDILKTVFKLAKKQTRVVFIPGNHDALFRDYCDNLIGKIEIQEQIIHTTAQGKQLLLIHGDQFDRIVQISPLIESIGSHAYDNLLILNGLVSKIRNYFKLSHWSLAGYLKRQVKDVVKYISNYERAIVTQAIHNEVDGVICGHIHHGELSVIDNMIYGNCGDWIESCTAIVEHHDGELELIHWNPLPSKNKK